MPACVIPFPARRPAAEPDRYALFQARVSEIFASAAAEQGLTREPQGLRREDEICQALRRIERRLSKMERLAAATAQRDLPAPRECL